MRGLIAAGWHWGATLGAPALRRMLDRRVALGKEEAARLGERCGVEHGARPAGQLAWIHAASVGEAVSVLPVLTSLAQQDPTLTVLFTTGTLTSARLLDRRLPELGLNRVLHRYVPLDVPAWAARFLDHWRPNVAAFVESELWPNLIAACQTRRDPDDADQRAHVGPAACVAGDGRAGLRGRWLAGSTACMRSRPIMRRD